MSRVRIAPWIEKTDRRSIKSFHFASSRQVCRVPGPLYRSSPIFQNMTLRIIQSDFLPSPNPPWRGGMVGFIPTVTVQNPGASPIRLSSGWISELMGGYVNQYYTDSLSPRDITSITAVSFGEFQIWDWEYRRLKTGTVLIHLLDTKANEYRHIHHPQGLSSFRQRLIYMKTAYRLKHPKLWNR